MVGVIYLRIVLSPEVAFVIRLGFWKELSRKINTVFVRTFVFHIAEFQTDVPAGLSRSFSDSAETCTKVYYLVDPKQDKLRNPNFE